MEKGSRQLLDRLATGPSFLLMGQAWPRLLGKEDPLLAVAFKRAGINDAPPTYRTILDLNAENRKRVYAALADVSRSATVPLWLDDITRYPWSGVLTTTIDLLLQRALDTEWRRVIPSVGKSGRAESLRSPSRLRLALLFGAAGLPEEDGPPLDRPTLASRRAEARELLSELAEGLLTPRGVLVADGFDADDWLSTEDFYGLTAGLLPGQVHVFSTSDSLAADEFIQAGVAQGQVIIHETSLGNFLAEAEERGRLIRPAWVGDVEGRYVRLGGHLVPVPRDEWNRITPSARPIDQSMLLPSSVAHGATLYQRFRSFLDSSDGPPMWGGLAAGFNLPRSFDEELFKLVEGKLIRGEFAEPVLIAGQSGSGKSVALALLARRIADLGEYVVLHAPRRGDRPQVTALDSFTLWAEEAGARGVLFVWDGMLESEDYFSIARQLRSRGRKFLIVGSCYLSGELSGHFDVPATLTKVEAQATQTWLGRFGVSIATRDLPLLEADSSFLAALYRILPETRKNLQQGLVLELRSAETAMEKIGANLKGTDSVPSTIMGQALARAGLLAPLFQPGSPSDDGETRFTDRSTAEQLTTMVVLAGQHDLRVPLELVLRVLGRDGALSLVSVIKQVNIVRWYEDDDGEQSLGTRNALEGQLLARAQLRDLRFESELIVSMLREIHPRSGPGGPEVQFAVDLVKRIGPESDLKSRYESTYLALAHGLRDARDVPSRAHPRLMLLEANLAREYAKRAQSNEVGLEPDQRMAVFEEAQSVLESALELAPKGRARANLLVELASTLGSQLYESGLGQAIRQPDTLRLLEGILSCVLQARTLEPSNYFPVDVMGWVAMAAVNRGLLSDTERLKVIADTIASFNTIDPGELSPSQAAHFHSRRAQVAHLLDDPATEEAHLAALAESQDPTAYYLLALQRSGLGFQGGQSTETSIREALDYLRTGPASVKSDWRCARLTLDLFWLDLTGEAFLRGRQVVHLSSSRWEECLQLADDLTEGAAAFDRFRVDFLRALALFHLGRYQQAGSAFIQLGRDTAGLPQRILATFVSAVAKDKPAIFTGQVQSVSNDLSRGRVWVDQLQTSIDFVPYRFGLEAPRKGSPVPEFLIEFNFLGPHAYPPRLSARESGSPQAAKSL